MVIVMIASATPEQINAVCAQISSMGCAVHDIFDGDQPVITAIGGEDAKTTLKTIGEMPGVASAHATLPYRLVCRTYREQHTQVQVGNAVVGGDGFVVIAGPCSVESEKQICVAADHLARAGASLLRGGAFKPRTSPYDFQGLGKQGLIFLAKARDISGLPFVTEVVSEADVELVAEYADMLQVGSRNMQNFSLLKTVGRSGRPVLLKRGMCSTIKELLTAAEYLLLNGNSRVVLCERGIRTFDSSTRNTCDLVAVPVLNELTHLPIIVDPSHSTGKRSLVPPLCRAAVAIGADGLIVEAHPQPEKAYSDGFQSIDLVEFAKLMDDLRPYLSLWEHSRRSMRFDANNGESAVLGSSKQYSSGGLIQ